MNNFTLTMEAQFIPSGTDVRKPQGQRTYRLQQSLTIYTVEGTRVIPVKDGAFLVGNGSINEIPKDKRLCIDFHDLSALTCWVREHKLDEWVDV